MPELQQSETSSSEEIETHGFGISLDKPEKSESGVQGRQTIEKFAKDVREIKGTVDYLRNKEIPKLRKQIYEERTKVVETLGLFVALFTLISVQFSIFKEINVFSAAVSLILIVGGILLLFIILLHVMIKPEKDRLAVEIYIVLFLLAVGLIYLGLNFRGTFFKVIFLTEDYPIKIATPSGKVVSSPLPSK